MDKKIQPLIDIQFKVCNYCLKEKPLVDFHKNKQCSYGRTGTCKVCLANKRSVWYNSNRARRQEEANNRNRQRKAYIVEHFGGICFDCQQQYPQYVYEFHHLDPTQKDVNPSKALSWREDRMWKELDKCIMLCSNCHKIRHYKLGEKEDRDETTN